MSYSLFKLKTLLERDLPAVI